MLSPQEELHAEIKLVSTEIFLPFFLLACERLFSNYCSFSKKHSFGNIEVLQQAIGMIEKIIVYKEKITNSTLEEIVNNIDSITPSAEDYDTVMAASAQDACMVVRETLLFLIHRDFQRILTVSTICMDTVNMYLQDKYKMYDTSNPEFWQIINTDPFMLREMHIQRTILSGLKSQAAIDVVKLKELRSLQYNNGKSNIDLS